MGFAHLMHSLSCTHQDPKRLESGVFLSPFNNIVARLRVTHSCSNIRLGASPFTFWRPIYVLLIKRCTDESR